MLKVQQLVANLKKCYFAQTSLEYLGHIISKDGVAMDPNKIKSVLQWHVPKIVKGARGFSGLTVYYRKFIMDYSKIAKHLTERTKEEGFKWSRKAQEAFDLLKGKITTASFLALLNFNQEFTIESDASIQGLGVILTQNG